MGCVILATTMSPEVSLSSRWTMPGLITPRFRQILAVRRRREPGAVKCPGAGGPQPRRLVHHDQPRVFIEDFEGTGSGRDEEFGGWKRDLDVVAGFQAVTGLREAVIDPDKAD